MTKTIKNLVLMLLLISQAASSQSSGGKYTLIKYVISSGGGQSTSSLGDYKLTATIGQPVTSEPLNNGDFKLIAGFWHTQDSLSDIIFSNGFEAKSKYWR